MTDAPKLSRVTYPALDGLRGVAVLFVMIHNLSILDLHSTIAQKIWVLFTDAGWIGVQLFFVLSGFLISGILIDDRGRPKYFKNFYIRRTLRIFPLYYATLAIRVFIVPLIAPGTEVPFEVAIWFALYISNWSVAIDTGTGGLPHFWSLAVEEQFYLVWPLVVSKLRARGLAIACLFIIAVSATVRVVIWQGGYDSHWLYMSTLTRADALAFGALVALAIRSPEWRARLAKYQWHIVIGAGAGLAVIMAHAHGLSRSNTWVEVFGYTLLAILFAVLVAQIALDETNSHPRWAMNRVLRSAGKYSYAAYVFHVPIKTIVMYYMNPWFNAHGIHDSAGYDMILVGILIAIAFACAVASYAILERPLLRLKDRLAPRV